ncbi:MAG: 3-phosphoshikimate 1-carboxyvinyltransferase [Thermodesulfobacteriota bacterium]|nr:3-phosphoshikimate 1-carboxyvinyltransferase [Thermodesulfobacteriota bacterium]
MEIKPIKNLDAEVSIPGSKSYTQRALIIASLAHGKSFLRNYLISEDTGYLIDGLRSLGSEILTTDEDIIICGTGGNITNPGKEIYLGNNGTAMRFLTSIVSLGKGKFSLGGDSRLCERPVNPLLDALRALGVDAHSKNKNGCPPVIINSNGIRGGSATFTNIQSSQYISSILICAPFAEKDTEINLKGSMVSLPYIDMTIETMTEFGVEVVRKSQDHYIIKSNQQYAGLRYMVEGDVSNASYFFLAAALCKGKTRVININPDTLQGDIGLLDIMEKLGCSVVRGDNWVEVTGKEMNRGEYVFDMGNMPDVVPTLAVLAAVRSGRTVIKNVSHLRVKESDRIAALVNELNRIGVRAEETDDGLIIDGGRPHAAEIETYNDHRIAMSFAMLGLATPNIKIKNKDCVNKSFPCFWDELERLYTAAG